LESLPLSSTNPSTKTQERRGQQKKKEVKRKKMKAYTTTYILGLYLTLRLVSSLNNPQNSETIVL
jgi:hypothetical protein